MIGIRMKIQLTKIKKNNKKWYRIESFTECEFPTKLSATGEVNYDKIGYLEQFPHVYISEDGSNITIQETPTQARVFSVGEEMPLHYYEAMCDQLGSIKRMFDLIDADDTAPLVWDGLVEKEIEPKTASLASTEIVTSKKDNML